MPVPGAMLRWCAAMVVAVAMTAGPRELQHTAGGTTAAPPGNGGAGDAAAPAGPPSTKKVPDYKVTVAGDSISVGLGSAIRTALVDDAVVKVIGEEGTGLARPDRFDWPARLAELAREFPPQVLVFSLSSTMPRTCATRTARSS